MKNSGPDVVYFTYYTPLQWLKYFTVSDELKVTKANPLTLQPGDAQVPSAIPSERTFNFFFDHSLLSFLRTQL